jgi:hypothetical protein
MEWCLIKQGEHYFLPVAVECYDGSEGMWQEEVMAYRHLVGGIGVQLKKFLEGKQTLAFGF